ncbi:MAG: hypothetical protein J6X49_09255 [Victivallales bacterium]|nr:hypothetical protein [Victivallales bacterium]
MFGHFFQPLTTACLCTGLDERRHLKEKPDDAPPPAHGTPDEIGRWFVAEKIPRKKWREKSGCACWKLQPPVATAYQGCKQQEGRNTLPVTSTDKPIETPQSDKGDDQKQKCGDSKQRQSPRP